ncbi:CheW domain protein [Stanieria cyanosphaera PCC 7437]|uniref:CheW domain protein n=1 Tax=Stanieria cyanosphaera (strain ATCC 29371 / PCC 7437) TaxID=111780 RepID=K9XYD2_STAC7|nr:chemotaxis protein CheW [Stanieria cyanosphaera]AFZ37543.1 CheW domain protein [Stanieria cyanosphaera PCC 7437]
MLNLFSPRQRLFNKTDSAQASLRAIIFSIKDYWFALPIEAVIKILPCPPINSPSKEGISIVDLEDRTITVVDLLYKLNHLEEGNEIEKICGLQRFLILTMTQTEEIFGLLVEHSPTLIDIPLNSIRTVPLSYRHVIELNFVKQMAILTDTQEHKLLKVFLLGTV